MNGNYCPQKHQIEQSIFFQTSLLLFLLLFAVTCQKYFAVEFADERSSGLWDFPSFASTNFSFCNMWQYLYIFIHMRRSFPICDWLRLVAPATESPINSYRPYHFSLLFSLLPYPLEYNLINEIHRSIAYHDVHPSPYAAVPSLSVLRCFMRFFIQPGIRRMYNPR